MPLEKEKKFFDGQKNELLKHHEGQFALIKGEKIHGFFPTEQEAFKKGIEIFGLEDMFIKQILKEEPKTFIPAFSTIKHARL